MFAGRPTGFRELTPALLQADRAAESFAGLPEGVSKPGQVLAAFKAAAPRLGLPVRVVHAVDWLFRFTRPQDWEEGARPIVWPSAETQQIALGLCPTQVKAINRQLIERGLLTMRDSPNGKRYGRRDKDERIVEAYGFDLSPLVARHAEFLRLAEEERVERQEVGRLGRRTTIARKAITQILETARQYGFADAEWDAVADESRRLVGLLRAVEGPAAMEPHVQALEARQTAARERLETLLQTVETDPREPEYRPHITVTKEESILAKDTVVARQGSSRDEAPPVPQRQPQPVAQVQPQPVTRSLENAPATVVMLNTKLTPGELVRLAPRLQDYVRRPDPSWPELVDAADWLRADLAISKALWGDACVLLGREAAAVAVAIVSTKEPAHFRTSAGGYFHGMLDKAKAGELNLDRTIWKLRTGGAGGGQGGGGDRPAPRTERSSLWPSGGAGRSWPRDLSTPEPSDRQSQARRGGG
jgi:replication initiation protein RepC